MACEQVTASITRHLAGERLVVAMPDPYNPTGSTTHVDFNPDFIVFVDDGRGDDDLLHLFVEVKGHRREVLIHEALTRLIQLEAGRRLALLGGSEPGAELPPRRRGPDR